MKTIQLTTDEIRFLLFALEETDNGVELHDNEELISSGLSAKLAAAL